MPIPPIPRSRSAGGTPMTLRRGVRAFASAALGMAALTSQMMAADSADIATLRARYHDWVLAGPEDYQNSFSELRLQTAIREAQRAMKSLKTINLDDTEPTLYDTTARGQDESELRRLIADSLPALSVAYQLPGSGKTPNPYYRNESVKAVLFKIFDHLDARGFRHPMQLPWKAAQVKQRDPGQAMIVDFILRTSGYALATFLMRDELRSSGRLDKALATCWEIESHPEKTGDLRAPYLQADGVRVVLNVSLPAALAEGNAARLQKLKAQLERSMTPESNAFDTIKPDGLGHHHYGVYMAGYAGFTVAEAAFAMWFLRDTAYACSEETVAHVVHGLETLRIVSQKYDMHQALGGRFPSAAVLPEVLLGYACVADLRHPNQHECQTMLARLADEAFMASSLPRQTFSPHRDEVPPGPGAIAFFLRTVGSAKAVGAEPDPQGHWSFNYGPLVVHRRDDWMVSIKGCSRYWWAFERSLTDARKDPRQENVFGFYDGAASLQICGQGQPWVNARDSGYTRDGWDWSRVPGTTARHLTAEELLAMDHDGERFNRPFGDSAFAGGVTLEGRNGVFAMDYTEAAPDQRKTPLRALKTAFFFDDQIVCLTSGIRDGDGVHPVETTLFQTALRDAKQTTYAQGVPIAGLDGPESVFPEGATQLVDAASNGYYIPAGNKVIVTRREQTSLDESATRATRGAFATAWVDHGPAPSNASCEYVILVRSGEKALANFAAHAPEEYRVLRQDDVAHIVTQYRLGLTGYAVAKAKSTIGDPLIDQTSAPCLMMTRRISDKEMRVSVCNPDFGWEKGVQYANRGASPSAPPMEPVPAPVTLTLNGCWTLPAPAAGVILASEEAHTVVTVACADARSVEFVIVRREN